MEGIAQKVGEKYHKSPFYCVFLLFFPLVIWTALQNHPASKTRAIIIIVIPLVFVSSVLVPQGPALFCLVNDELFEKRNKGPLNNLIIDENKGFYN